VSGSGLCDALAGGGSRVAAPRSLCSASDVSLSLLLVTSPVRAWEAGATMCTADYMLMRSETYLVQHSLLLSECSRAHSELI